MQREQSRLSRNWLSASAGASAGGGDGVLLSLLMPWAVRAYMPIGNVFNVYVEHRNRFFGGSLGPKEQLYMVPVSRKTLRPSVGVVHVPNHLRNGALHTVHLDLRQLLVASCAEAEAPIRAHSLLQP